MNIFLKTFINKRVINIREKYPIIIFDDESFLNIECSWRVRDSNSILLGYYEYDSEKTHTAMYKKLVDL
ncbi:MAG: hypothetical protein MJA84_04195, partial [Firmicutes bacterium]|nr:hypothetical protein [Bacillota bacterium]